MSVGLEAPQAPHSSAAAVAPASDSPAVDAANKDTCAQFF